MATEESKKSKPLGVSIKVLERILKFATDLGLPEDCNIYDIANKEQKETQSKFTVMKLLTQKYKDSLVNELLDADKRCVSDSDHENKCRDISKIVFHDIGIGASEATVFISYAWGFQLKELVATLRSWIQRNSKDEAKTFFWLDFCCVSQYFRPEKDSYDSFADTFKKSIELIGEALFLMLPKKSQIPSQLPWKEEGSSLTRIWCIWEIHCIIDSGVKWRVLWSDAYNDAVKTFLSNLAQREFNIQCVVESINVETADATVKEDKIKIINAIKATKTDNALGFLNTKVQDTINGNILTALGEWFWSFNGMHLCGYKTLLSSFSARKLDPFHRFFDEVLYPRYCKAEKKCFLDITVPGLNLQSRGYKSANTFVSHHYITPFQDYVSALEEFESTNRSSSPEIAYSYSDVLAQNESAIEDFKLKFGSQQYGEFYIPLYSQRVRSMERFIMIMHPWNEPTILTRAFPLYELSVASANAQEVHVAMSKAQEDAFISVLQEPNGKISIDSAIEYYRAAITGQHATDSEGVNQIKRELFNRIDSELLKSGMSKDQVADKLVSSFKTWMLRVFKEHQPSITLDPSIELLLTSEASHVPKKART